MQKEPTPWKDRLSNPAERGVPMDTSGQMGKHLVDESKLACFRPPALPIQLLSDPIFYLSSSWFCLLSV